MLPPTQTALVVLGLVAVVAAGCGSSNSSTTSSSSASRSTSSSTTGRTVDTQQVEQGIKSSLSVSGANVTKAACPSNVPKQVDATFTCSVTFSNGATGKVTVTQKPANHYTYTLQDGSVQIPGATVDAQLEKQLAAQGFPNATVTCPSNIIVKVGTTVTCNVSGASGYAAGTVTFTFSSAEGTIDTSSVKPA